MNRSGTRAGLSPVEATRIGQVDVLLLHGEQGVAPLIEMTTDPSWAVRRAVVSALAALGDVAAPALCEVLRSRRDDESRLAAVVDALVACTGRSTEAYVGRLAESEVPAVLADVAQILGRRNAKASGPLLIELARHPDDNVAVAAIEALGRIGGRAAIEALIETVRGGGFFRSFPAIDVLGRSGDPRAVEALAELLEDPRLASEATRALGRSGERRATAPLARLLVHSSDSMVRVAAVALAELEARHAARLGDGRAIRDALRALAEAPMARRLIQGLGGADIQEQAAIASVLGMLGGAEAVAGLIRMLDAPAPAGPAAAHALANLMHTTENELLESLAEGDSARRFVLLPLMNRAPAVPAVTRCLEDPDPAVRVLACEALARIGVPAAVPAVFKLLSEANPRVQQAAVAAIQSLGGPQAEALALDAARSGWPTVRRAALRILSYFGWPSALRVLIEALQDADQRVRETAVQGLPFIQDRGAVDELLAVAKGPEERMRAAAVRALGHCRGDLRVIASLLRSLTDVDPWVRYHGCQSLGRLGVENATSAIAKLLEDPAGQVRVAAIEALSHLQGELAFSALRTVAESADPDVQRAALVGLGISRRPEAEPVLVKAAASRDAATRLVAISAIADFVETPAVIECLARASRDPDPAVQSAAVGYLSARAGAAATACLIELLARAPDPERLIAALEVVVDGRIPALAAALDAADDELAPRLVSALARMRKPEADLALRQAFRLENPAARKAVASAVAAQTSKEAAELLQQAAVADPDPEVRRIAALLIAG